MNSGRAVTRTETVADLAWVLAWVPGARALASRTISKVFVVPCVESAAWGAKAGCKTHLYLQQLHLEGKISQRTVQRSVGDIQSCGRSGKDGSI